MAAGRYDITIEQGATYTLTMDWNDTSGVLRDLSSGWTARMKAKPSIGSATTLFSLTNGAGITLAATSPNITITISATDTAALTAPGVYDLELVNGSTVYRVLQGNIRLDEEVTT